MLNWAGKWCRSCVTRCWSSNRHGSSSFITLFLCTNQDDEPTPVHVALCFGHINSFRFLKVVHKHLDKKKEMPLICSSFWTCFDHNPTRIVNICKHEMLGNTTGGQPTWKQWSNDLPIQLSTASKTNKAAARNDYFKHPVTGMAEKMKVSSRMTVQSPIWLKLVCFFWFFWVSYVSCSICSCWISGILKDILTSIFLHILKCCSLIIFAHVQFGFHISIQPISTFPVYLDLPHLDKHEHLFQLGFRQKTNKIPRKQVPKKKQFNLGLFF